MSAESNEAKKDQAWVEAARRLIRMPGAFRTYDTITFTGVATTIARNATLLRGAPDATQKATLNCEDEVYIGAALGLALGVQRALIPGVRYVADPSPRDFGQRVTESVRALRWQRIAPPVAAGVSPVEADPKYLWDSWKFSDGQTWLRAAIGKEVWQGAPARVARAIRLPDVKTQGIPPFVLASRHPNGASAIATVGRMSAHRGWLAPRASIAIQGCLLDAPIGIFGVYKDLEISFAAVITKHRVLMQDLAADHAVDVTSEVRIMRNIIIIPGELCDRICASSSADHSEPGVVLRLISRA